MAKPCFLSGNSACFAEHVSPRSTCPILQSVARRLLVETAALQLMPPLFSDRAVLSSLCAPCITSIASVQEAYTAYQQHFRESPASFLRDCLELTPAGEAIPLEEVESAASIMERFCTGGMSLGAISRETHETIAVAMNRIGGGLPLTLSARLLIDMRPTASRGLLSLHRHGLALGGAGLALLLWQASQPFLEYALPCHLVTP